jgi:hypothetical protein
MYFTPFMLGKSGSVPVLDGLLLHFDATKPTYVYTDAGVTPVSASGQAVARWRSTMSNDFYQQAATPSNRPTFFTGGLNGKSYVNFDGVNDCMEMAWATKFATNAKSFFIVMTPLASTPTMAYPYFFSFGQATKGTQIYMYNNSPKYWEWSQGGWTVNFARSATSDYVQGTPKILIGRSAYPGSATGIKLWVSGNETHSQSSNSVINYGTPPRAVIGGEPDGNTTIRNKSNFSVYEFGFFNKFLTDTERTLLANYFRTKYAIL